MLLLDEPFGALDALTRANLQEELTQLWQSDSSTEIVLMVTHGVDEATLLSDRVVVMANPPGPSIVEELVVGIDRPRSEATADLPRFREVHDSLMTQLRAENNHAA